MTNPEVRDIAADYLKAYRAEYNSYKQAGLDDRAKDVAATLRAMGHEVEHVKERAVPTDELEHAVEDEPKRRGRPRKAE